MMFMPECVRVSAYMYVHMTVRARVCVCVCVCVYHQRKRSVYSAKLAIQSGG